MEKKTTFKTIKNCIAAALMILGFMSTANAQNLTSTLGESWTGNSWENEFQSVNTYNASNFLVGTLSQVWIIPPGQWQNGTRLTYTNNATGGAIQILIEAWDTDTNTWILSQRITNTLNASNQVLTSITEMSFGTGWMNVSKQTNTYGGGFLTTSLLQTWNFVGSAWVNSLLITYTNNANGTVNQSVAQTWVAGENVWVNSSRSTFTYNGANQMLTEVEETWVDGAWQNERLTTNTYSGGWLSISLTQIWVVPSSTWENDTQSLYTNNANGTPSQVVVQEWGYGESTLILGTASWVNSVRLTFTYQGLGIDDIAKNGVVIFPNPVRDFVTIKSDTDEIRTWSLADQQGRTVLQGAFSDFESSVDLSGLSSGMYFFQIGESRKAAIKLIKQ